MVSISSFYQTSRRAWEMACLSWLLIFRIWYSYHYLALIISNTTITLFTNIIRPLLSSYFLKKFFEFGRWPRYVENHFYESYLKWPLALPKQQKKIGNVEIIFINVRRKQQEPKIVVVKTQVTVGIIIRSIHSF